MIPLTVVDNFFDDPEEIRKFALLQDYFRGDWVQWPGLRSPDLNLLDQALFHTLSNKILSLFFEERKKIDIELKASFQITTKKYEMGWIHTDDPVSFAGVIYLNPETDPTCGTSIYQLSNYKLEDLYTEIVANAKMEFYNRINDSIDFSNHRKIRTNYNSNFKKTCDISNVYNRLVLYSGNTLHAENGFFGMNKFDARMTLVFFVRIQKSESKFPLERL